MEQLPTYTWRGKTYKTMGGFFRAMIKVYGSCGMSFSKNTCVLSFRESPLGNTRYKTFDRSFDDAGNSIVSAEPASVRS